MPNTVQEAKRYLDNAKEILREKAKKEDGFYQDRSDVRLAGNTAFKGVLVALNGLFHPSNEEQEDLDWYSSQIEKIDRMAKIEFDGIYDTVNLAMGYDGNRSVVISLAGIKIAESFINWVETRTAVA